MAKKSSKKNNKLEPLSEEERWARVFSRCRNCKHPRITHFSVGIKKCADVTLSVDSEYKECYCKNFAPSDNLEFLEWKYQQKKGKND